MTSTRFPWRVRSLLLAAVNAVGAVFVTLASMGDVSPWTAGLAGFAAFIADLGIVRDGEALTTPLDDPLGYDGLPLVSGRWVEDDGGHQAG